MDKPSLQTACTTKLDQPRPATRALYFGQVMPIVHVFHTRFLREEQRQDVEAPQTAVLGLVYGAERIHAF